MVNLPIMKDEIGLRVTGYYRNEDGWVDNIGTGVEDANSLEAFGGRAILLLQPSDRMKVKLLASYENSRSEEHTSELQSLMRISYAVFCLKKKNKKSQQEPNSTRVDKKTEHINTEKTCKERKHQ